MTLNQLLDDMEMSDLNETVSIVQMKDSQVEPCQVEDALNRFSSALALAEVSKVLAKAASSTSAAATSTQKSVVAEEQPPDNISNNNDGVKIADVIGCSLVVISLLAIVITCVQSYGIINRQNQIRPYLQNQFHSNQGNTKINSNDAVIMNRQFSCAEDHKPVPFKGHVIVDGREVAVMRVFGCLGMETLDLIQYVTPQLGDVLHHCGKSIRFIKDNKGNDFNMQHDDDDDDGTNAVEAWIIIND